MGGETYACEHYTGRSAAGVSLIFIGNAELFGAVPSMSAGESADVARRAAVLAKAAASIVGEGDISFDAVHAHGWVGALALQRATDVGALEDRASVLTIHDVTDQGAFEGEVADLLELGDSASALAAGIAVADAVTTVSPTYARALLTPEGGHGLDETLVALTPSLVGIANGLDSSIWNPLTDAHLPARFDPVDRAGKGQCKAGLQRELSLPVRADIPLLGVIGTTDAKDGLALFTKIAPDMLRNDVQVVVQVDGGGELISELEELWDRWPDRIQIRTGSDEATTHKIVGAADLVIIPARVAPSGAPELAAQRYGAIPVVHHTGGLADSVVDCDAALKTGTGFVYEDPTTEDLLAAIRRAIAAHTTPEAFSALQKRVMRVDTSWERSARLYDRVYRHAAGETDEEDDDDEGENDDEAAA